jgi:hypothetical protein
MKAKLYTTFHIQKDRRINLGYCVHRFLDCPALKDRKPVEIAGPITALIPKCSYCFERHKGK